jgi:hypothetical protein
MEERDIEQYSISSQSQFARMDNICLKQILEGKISIYLRRPQSAQTKKCLAT